MKLSTRTNSAVSGGFANRSSFQSQASISSRMYLSWSTVVRYSTPITHLIRRWVMREKLVTGLSDNIALGTKTGLLSN
ncbi:MAG: hypothetical protein AAF253_08860, partial [Pseudomonadota bacterium]